MFKDKPGQEGKSFNSLPDVGKNSSRDGLSHLWRSESLFIELCNDTCSVFVVFNV